LDFAINFSKFDAIFCFSVSWLLANEEITRTRKEAIKGNFLYIPYFPPDPKGPYHIWDN
jgi:hypothetical protein